MAITSVEVNQLNDLLKDEGSILLDVREDYEYEDDHLDSLHIPMAEVRSRMSLLDPYKKIIVCCKSGKRAQAVSHLLFMNMPGKDISYLNGGLEAYREVYATK